jgi:hypothetical protein
MRNVEVYSCGLRAGSHPRGPRSDARDHDRGVARQEYRIAPSCCSRYTSRCWKSGGEPVTITEILWLGLLCLYLLLIEPEDMDGHVSEEDNDLTGTPSA